MIRSRWSKWLSGVGGVVLIGGLVLANYGAGVTPAEAHHDYKNPFKQILGKLNLILDGLNDLKAGGSGAPSSSAGGGAGNQSLRWDTNNLSTSRFTVLTDFGSAAVRDNNTGLVWEKSPSTMDEWYLARLDCLNKAVPAVVGTRGWRLPSVVELVSLIDPDPVSGKPIMPVEFAGVPLANYWSATTSANNTTAFTAGTILSVDFGNGQVGNSPKTSPNYVWCVRGPMSESVY